MDIRRDTFWNISLSMQILLYILAGIAIIIFCYGFYRRFRLWKKGRKESIDWHIVKGNLKYFFNLVVKQTKLKRDKSMGYFHKLLSYGFVALFIGTVLVFIDQDFKIPILQGTFYLWYELILDIFGVLFIIGLLAFLVVRNGNKRPRMFDGRTDRAFLWILLAIGIGGFVTEGIRIAETQIDHAPWSPVGYMLSKLFAGTVLFSAESYIYWWLSHAVFAFIWIALIPYTKLFHILTAPLNILITPTKRTGDFTASPAEIEGAHAAITLEDHKVVNKISDFTSLQLLSTDACTECGRCESLCPAHLSGKSLSPRNIVLKIRDNMHRDAEISEFISDDELNACTTCGACVEACPVSINQIDLILSMRRGNTTDGNLTEQWEDVLINMENDQNIWGKPWSSRTDWTRGLNVRNLEDKQDNREAK